MRRIAAIALLFLFKSATAQFSDDFSTGGANTNWLKNPAELSMKFENGACTIANTDTVYSAFAYHTFTTALSTFTLGGSITLSSPSTQTAGFICCLAATGMATGYYVSIERNERISVEKVDATGKGSSLVLQRFGYFNSGANELQISKSGATFNIFCNGRFVATFSDNTFDKGNIAMQLSPKTTAVFDNIVMTPTFLPGEPATCFADDFNDGDLRGWDSFGSEASEVINSDKTMLITNGKDETVYEVIDLPLKEFVLRATFSHRGGSTKNLYGLFVSGLSGNTVPLCGFGINAGRNFAAFTGGQTIQPAASTKIKGAAYIAPPDTTWYTDTLEVFRRKGASECLFVINGDTLSRFAGVTFDVTGAGVFCTDSLTVRVDDFLVAQGENAICPVRQVTRLAPLSRATLFGGRTLQEFDILGRSFAKGRVYSASATSGVRVLRGSGDASLRLRVK